VTVANMRGASLLGTLDYARQTFGADALERVLAAVSPETRAVIGDPLRPSILTQGWYDCRLVSDLTRAVDQACGKGDLALARAAGKHVAFEDVNRFFKWLLRLTGPATIFTRAGSVWNNYHSAGRYVFEGLDGRRARIRIDDWDSAEPVICRRIEGWMERALELTLGAGTRPAIREEAHLAKDPAVGPHPFCRYLAEW
jgi:hypothetical protein